MGCVWEAFDEGCSDPAGLLAGAKLQLVDRVPTKRKAIASL